MSRGARIRFQHSKGKDIRGLFPKTVARSQEKTNVKLNAGILHLRTGECRESPDGEGKMTTLSTMVGWMIVRRGQVDIRPPRESSHFLLAPITNDLHSHTNETIPVTH